MKLHTQLQHARKASLKSPLDIFTPQELRWHQLVTSDDPKILARRQAHVTQGLRAWCGETLPNASARNQTHRACAETVDKLEQTPWALTIDEYFMLSGIARAQTPQ